MNLNKRNNHYLFLIVLSIITAFSLIIFSACNDRPTAVGASFLNDTISLGIANSDSVNLIYAQKNVLYRQPLVNTGAVLIGKTGDSRAVLLLDFIVPDSLGYIQTSNIISSKLSIQPTRYTFGDSAGTNFLGFNIYKGNKFWTNFATWDSLFPISYFSPDRFDNSFSLGSWQGKIDLKDTADQLVMDIDKSIIAEWLKNQTDTSLIFKNFGIALVPFENSTVIRRFVGENNTDDTFRIKIQVVFNDSLGKTDTTNLFSARELSVVSTPNLTQNRLVMQGAVEKDFQLFFDVSMLPPIAGIHDAELSLTLDTSLCIPGNVPLDSTLYATYYAGDSIVGTPLNSFVASRAPGTNIFIFPSISSAVSTWCKSPSRKGTLVFSPDGFDKQKFQMSRLVFYGLNEPDKNKVPKLKIIYSSRPKLK